MHVFAARFYATTTTTTTRRCVWEETHSIWWRKKQKGWVGRERDYLFPFPLHCGFFFMRLSFFTTLFPVFPSSLTRLPQAKIKVPPCSAIHTNYTRVSNRKCLMYPNSSQKTDCLSHPILRHEFYYPRETKISSRQSSQAQRAGCRRATSRR